MTTLEVFYRIQFTPGLTVTPGVQFLWNPARKPFADQITIFEIRARLAF